MTSAKAELIRYFWSGKHHKVVKGINLISLYYSDLQGNSVPLNYRIYDKDDSKTKNEYFREMVLEVLAWGVRPAMVTGDSWYSGVENLKFLKKQELDFLFAVEKNRTVSNEPGVYCQVQTLEIPPDGLVTHLKDFGFVKVFRTVLKHQDDRHYVLYRQARQQLELTTRAQFQLLHNAHWTIENFHRAVKQVCNLERFMVRSNDAIRTHIFCSIRAFVQLELMRVQNLISNWYELQRNLFKQTIREYILENLAQTDDSRTTHYYPRVNA